MAAAKNKPQITRTISRHSDHESGAAHESGTALSGIILVEK